MKQNQKIWRALTLLIAIFCLIAGSKVQAKESDKVAHVEYNKENNTLVVTCKNIPMGTSLYKKEVVYANTDISSFRKGPSSSFKKVKSLRKDLGEKIIKVGNLKFNRWAIVLENGHYYFVPNKYLSTKEPVKKLSSDKYSSSQLKFRGVIHWNGWRWTWYSQKVMPGHGLSIPGRHVDKKRFVCDKDGYICLASGKLRKGTVVSTPFGKKGKVYDSGCGRNTLDVYTNF